MEVTVHGQTIATYIITVKDASDQTKEFDIATELVVGENLELEVRDAAAKAHFFHQLSIDAEHELEDFKKTFYEPYLAHTEKFARYYLKAAGAKDPTGTAKEKAAMLLFAEEVDEMAEAATAYIGYKDEVKKVGISVMTEPEFKDKMYSYDPMPVIERVHLGLKHKAAQLRAVSSGFNEKSWSIKTAAADHRARLGANIA